MKKIFVGIDVSKGWLDYSTCDDSIKILDFGKQVANSISGITSMLNKLKKAYPEECLWFCFEHTGNYSLLLCSMLESMEYAYSMVPAIEVKKSFGLTRGKTDQIDAKRLAEYAATHSHKLKETHLPSNDLLKVKNLLAYRSQLIKSRSAYVNSLKSYQEAEKIVEISFITEDLQHKVQNLKKDIDVVDKQIQQVIADSTDLHKNYRLVSSVKGIGLVIAAYMLVYTNNFTSFDDPRKFNCFTGLAPFESSSGIKKGKPKTSHYRHKHLKALLFNGANSASMYDPQIKNYYIKKREEGKNHLSIMNAVACKIVSRAFATVKRQTPYVILSH